MKTRTTDTLLLVITLLVSPMYVWSQVYSFTGQISSANRFIIPLLALCCIFLRTSAKKKKSTRINA